MGKGYKSIKGISDVKYKGLHPVDKKKFIKGVNEKIKEFNNFWNGEALKKIQTTAKEILETDDDNLKKIQKILNKNKVKVSLTGIKNAIDKGYITELDSLSILSKVSGAYRTKVKNFLLDVAKETPKETLKAKTERVNDFFEKDACHSLDDKFKSSLERAITPLITAQFKHAAKKEKKEKLLLEDEANASMINFIKKFIAHTKNYHDNDMSEDLKENIVKALTSLKKSIQTNNETKLNASYISLLRNIMEALSEKKQEMNKEVKKEQRQSKNSKNLDEHYGILRDELLGIVGNSKTSSSENIKKSLKAIAQSSQKNPQAQSASNAAKFNSKGKQAPPLPPVVKSKPAAPAQDSTAAKDSSKQQIPAPPPPPPEGLKPPVNDQTKSSSSAEKSENQHSKAFANVLEDIKKDKKLKKATDRTTTDRTTETNKKNELNDELNDELKTALKKRRPDICPDDKEEDDDENTDSDWDWD